ncbi:NACHT, LRR and PYD domains-containing protein 12-like [Alosa pseudoharengus]|uniref:NACHT, LRR and PYD domains-containing protein 12-like n=1 Tax=Alosa pseudoharengus TaxID=34774 RepID=UPI003F8CE24B
MAVNSLDLLFRTLDELKAEDLKRFRTYLSERTVEGCEAFPKGKLEDKDATDVASEMKKAYGEEGSVKMTLTILRKMNLNDLADKLERPQTQRPPSPVPSGVSMKSDASMPEPLTFSSGPVPSGLKPQTQRPPSPVPSGVSMKSDASMPEPLTFSSGPVPSGLKPQTQRPPSPVPSGVSMKSDASMPEPLTFSSGPVPSGLKPQTQRPPSPVPSGVSMKSDASMPEPLTFSSGPVPSGLKPQTQRPPSPVPSGVSMKSDASMPEPLTFSSGPVPSGLKDVAESGERDVYAILQEVKAKHKKWMIEKFGEIHECLEDGKNKTLLSKIYTELYITKGESEGVNKEHEVCRTQSKSQRANEDKINCNDIFKCLLEDKKIRTVMTTGIAGIGKSVCVQKFILDWAEGGTHQDVDFIFALPFRQLNLMNDSYTLHQLLLDFHLELDEKVMNPQMFRKSKIILIFDGLDESKLSLNVEQSKYIHDPLKTASVDVLISNLIKGNLLPNALIWITSRPAAVKMIPPKYIDRWTEVQGFNDQQKDEYFKKKIENPAKADTAIAHIKRSKSIYIMCHIPVFCWILASVLLKMISLTSTSDLPQTLTEVYIYFLLTETNRKGQKYGKGFERDAKKRLEFNKDAILKLSELAYKELLKGNILFYEDSLKECGINEEDITLYSGMCSEFFTSECAVDQHKVYCFVHLSIQEFLAALFVFHSFVTKNIEALRQFISQESPSNLSMTKFLRTAIDKSMQKEDGHLDLFLRFLLGISLESNQKLLQGLLTRTESSSDSLKETAENIKIILSEDTEVPERCMNLLLCLLEMKDNSLHQEIQQYIDSGKELSPAQCSSLAYMLLVSEETLDELDLAKYKSSNEGRRRLLIVVKACRKARLVGCELKEESCEVLTSALQSENFLLKELDLSFNLLEDSGVEMLLSVGLKHANCRLETLRLADCKLTEKSYEMVASVLQSPNSLQQLDLSDNYLGDSGVQLLSKGLSSSNCKIHTLRLTDCKLSERSCRIVASVLQSPNSMIELDLSHNVLRDSGVYLLSKGLSSSHCKLQTLRLADCKLTDKLGEIVASVLQSPNSMIELDLSHNVLRDSGVYLLSKGLSSSHCKLQTLRLADCKLTDKLGEIVASVLQSPNSLLQLNFSNNDPGDSGVELLSKGLSSSNSILQILRLADCKLTYKSCEMVASVLQSPNSLQELDLSDNDLGDSGAQLLSKGLSSSNCKIHTLRLSDCLISEKGCGVLAAALTSNHLKALDLRHNTLGESGLKLLSARLEDPVCKLAILETGASVSRARPHLLRYACDLTLDPNTADRFLSLSEGNRKVTRVEELQPYPEHPERFDSMCQVLCREGLTGRCYWEAEWSGDYRADISVAYKSIERKGGSDDVIMGLNAESWSLECYSDHRYSVRHNKKRTVIPAPSSDSRTVGVYLDWPAGTLSFYSVSTNTLTHLHTFHSTFTEPLYPGFVVGYYSSVSLRKIT